jgi:hypothetical protein
MTLTIAQDSRRRRDDYWEWSAWIEGSSSELGSIGAVTWILHPTFPNPIRTTYDRATKFRIDTAGWGVFTLRARVTYRDGSRENLEHYLRFDAGESKVSGNARGSFVLLYPAEDADVAAAIADLLRDMGTEVIDPAASDDGFALLLGRAQGVVAVGRDKEPSRAVAQRILTAKEMRKPVLLLKVDAPEKLKGSTGAQKLRKFVRDTGEA